MRAAGKRLQVSFDPPATGGITMRLIAPHAEFAENFSHIYPSSIGEHYVVSKLRSQKRRFERSGIHRFLRQRWQRSPAW